ncbi:hypothetical protein EBU71_16025, partial [bacterium]|nr:hypothetical protein [Candidatus Elulimicrobium humile]
MMVCSDVEPVSAFYSTNLQSKILSYERLGQRVCRALGAPLVNLEIHADQLNEFIGIACEMFTKFAGYTQEYLVFNSELYEKHKGLRLDVLFSLTKDFNFRAKIKDISPEIKKLYNLGSMVIGDPEHPYIFQVFDENNPNEFNLLNSYDYLVDDYRRVIDVTDFEEGSNDGINTLFTIEQTLAQQTYFSYSLGNYGFDLVSWNVLKNWLDTREKVLALRRDFRFDPRTQYLQLFPEPKDSRFYGIVTCYVERPLVDIIKEPWVYQYALALTKIAIGSVRGKYTNVQLFGGGSINYNDML